MNVAIDRGPPASRRTPSVHPAEFGMWFFLATVTMLFAAFASSYLIRRTSSDWVPIALPSILWFNTIVLLASSATLEMAKRRFSHPGRRLAERWLDASFLLGLLFVAGQLSAWRALAAQGVFLPTSPHASFFYLLTALHIVHVAAGLLLMVSVRLRISRPETDEETAARLLRIIGSYWHYMGGLWIFLFLVLARL